MTNMQVQFRPPQPFTGQVVIEDEWNCVTIYVCALLFSDLRRSPRTKKFTRRNSSTFYSSSQPRSRNLDRALSASQLNLSEGKISEFKLKPVRSPMRLLFGAADSPNRPSDQSGTYRATRSRLCTDSSVFEVTFYMHFHIHLSQYFQMTVL